MIIGGISILFPQIILKLFWVLMEVSDKWRPKHLQSFKDFWGGGPLFDKYFCIIFRIAGVGYMVYGVLLLRGYI